MMQRSTPAGLPDPSRDARFYEDVPLRRLAAFALDVLGSGLLGLLAALVFGVATLGFGFLALAPIMLATSFAWRALGLARLSATPGLWVVGVELRRADGARLDAATALAHTAVYFACFFAVLPQIASVWMMATAPAGRGLHDALLGVTAIHRPA